MAITTLAGALSGMQPPQAFSKLFSNNFSVNAYPLSSWYAGGVPQAGTMNTTTSGGVALSSSSALVPGQIPHFDPPSGNSYLGRFSATVQTAGLLLLCDRLLHCGKAGGSAISVTSFSAQTLNTTTLPARDDNGQTNGVGVQCGIEISSGTGAFSSIYATVSYTNSSGTSGRSGTTVSDLASVAQGQIFPLQLAAGDFDVRSVQSLTLSASLTSGGIGIVLYRILAGLEIPVNSANTVLDALTSGFPQIYNGCVPFLIFVPLGLGGPLGQLSGTYTETWG